MVQRLRETEVSQLNQAIVGNEQVVGLNVLRLTHHSMAHPVNDLLCVHIEQPH